jgi:CHAT domain-containing protein
MTRRHIHAALGLVLMALLGGCAAPGPSPEALTELTLALEDPEQGGEARLAELLLRYPDHLPLLELALAHSEARGDQEGRLRYARAAFSAALGAGLSPNALGLREQALLDALRAPSALPPASMLEAGGSADNQAFLDELAFLQLEAQALFEDGAAEEAFGTLELALVLADDVLGASSEESQRLSLSLGDLALVLGDPRRAEGLYGAVVEGGAPALAQTARIRLAELYEQEGRMAAAAAVTEQALGAAQNPLDRATLARALGRRLDQAGQLSAGLSAVQAACDALAEAGHPLLSPVLECRQSRVVMLARGGHSSEALAALEALQAQRAQRFGGQAPETLRGELDRANLERALGQRTAARARLEALASAPGFSDGALGSEMAAEMTAELKEAQARLAFDAGADRQALEAAQESLRLREALFADDHPLLLETKNLLAAITLRLGDRPAAEGAWREVLAGFEQRYGEESLATLTVMSNLGMLLEQVGLFDEAEPLLRDALAAARTVLGPTHPQTLTIMNNLALLLESQGTFDQAEALYLEPLETLRAQGQGDRPEALAMENNLAYLYLLQGAGAEAQRRFAELFDRFAGTLGPTHPDTLRALNNRGRAEALLGDLNAARQSLLSALAGREARYGPLHRDVIRSQIDLGSLEQREGALAAAEARLRDALSRAERGLGEAHPYTFDALNALAAVLRQQGKKEAAFRLQRTGFERRTAFFQRVLPVTGENAREGYLRLHRPELDAFLALIPDHPDEAEAGRALLEVSLARKGLLLAIASDIAQIAALGLNPELSALTEALADARETLAQLTLGGPGEGDPLAHLAKLRAEEGRIEDLQRALGRASLRYQQTIEAPSVDELAAELPAEGAALVDFLAYRDDEGTRRLLAAVLQRDPDGSLAVQPVTFAPLDKIEEGIRYYRELIQDEGVGDDELLEEGMFLYEDVWAPVAEYLDPDLPVYLVPDGLLNILPFDALVDEDERYLLETLDLRVLSSARDLLPHRLPAAGAPPLVMAGPDYDTDAVADPEQLAQARSRAAGRPAPAPRRGQEEEALPTSRAAVVLESLRAASDGLRGLSFSPLPGARLEGELIVRRLGEEPSASPEILTALDAQEAVLGQLTAPPTILHLATHGFFLAPEEKLRKRLMKAQRSAEMVIPPPGDNPLLRAGLAFAGINENAPFFGQLDTRNDGVLTAMEVLDLDLTGTQLAVLSACETGLGEIHEGEGVYGLRRAFQEAGVREVVTSLWEVSDAGTQALMTAMYARLAEGMAPREALREAQRELAASPRWGYPYVWAAFMMVSR